jgi:hypothetical protein
MRRRMEDCLILLITALLLVDGDPLLHPAEDLLDDEEFSDCNTGMYRCLLLLKKGQAFLDVKSYHE